MNTDGLKLHKRTWYARLRVPVTLRPLVGKSEYIRTLKTRDIGEANRRKFAVLAELQAELHRDARQASRGGEAAGLVDLAGQLRAAELSGELSPEQAEAAQDASTERFLDAAAAAHGRDSATGEPNLPPTELRAIRAAYGVLKGAPLLVTTIEDYLTEKAPHIRRQTLSEKRRQLEELSAWLGADCRVKEVTKAQAGRYVSDRLLKKGHKPKTTKDTLSNLSAFWAWLEGRGLADFNVWHRMSGTVRGSTRGQEAVRRPWSDDELLKLLQGIPEGDPLLPMTAIAAYSGMRREEVAQLKTSDIAKDGAFIIREGKSAAAVRRVPVHPVIRPLVAELVKSSRDGFLIPGLLTGGADAKRAHYIGKRFTELKRKLGFKDSALVFHTLRNAFAQRCEEAGVPESTTKLIVGHSRQDSLTYGRYSPGVQFDALRDAVVQVTFGKVDRFAKALKGKAVVTMKSARRYKRAAAA